MIRCDDIRQSPFVVPVCADKKGRGKKRDKDGRWNSEEPQCLFLAHLKINVDDQVPRCEEMHTDHTILFLARQSRLEPLL